MSDKQTNNFFTIGAAIIIVIAAVSWFSITSVEHGVAVNKIETEQNIVHVNEIIEEIVVVADEELAFDELADKANEADIRNQVNEAVKKSEDTDITNAENAE
tara:strand:+ start:424 stop:729 length:306 start_codon:yes stop_codon:yes gene_type:complete